MTNRSSDNTSHAGRAGPEEFAPSRYALRVGDFAAVTKARLAVIATNGTLRNAAVALSGPHIGLVVICAENGTVAGVVSKSDLVRYLMLDAIPDASVVVQMSRDIVSCRPEDDLYSTWKVMVAGGFQNIPVLGTDSKPLGVLDIRDAMKALFEHEEHQERLLFDYVASVGYQ
jgi:CBS domain-containing protein